MFSAPSCHLSIGKILYIHTEKEQYQWPKQTLTNPPVPNSYELMAMRVQRTINATAAQTAKRAVIYKSSDELEADWDQLLIDIGETENVTLTHREDGGVLISWVVPKEY